MLNNTRWSLRWRVVHKPSEISWIFFPLQVGTSYRELFVSGRETMSTLTSQCWDRVWLESVQDLNINDSVASYVHKDSFVWKIMLSCRHPSLLVLPICLPSHVDSWPQKAEVSWRELICNWVFSSFFLSAPIPEVGFCVNTHLLQEETSVLMAEGYLSIKIKRSLIPTIKMLSGKV